MSKESELLQKLNLKKHIQDEILKNQDLKQKFFTTLETTNTNELPANQSLLFFEMVSQAKSLSNLNLEFFLDYIKTEKIKNKIQIAEAVEFLKQNNEYDYQNIEELNEKIGVGLEYSDEDIEKYINDFIQQNLEMIKQNPFDKKVMKLLREGLKFADQGKLVSNFNKKAKEYKTEQPQQKKGDKKKQKSKNDQKKDDQFNEQETDEMVKNYDLKKLVARDMKESKNKKEIYNEHIKRTNGKVITRFPPEPNGYLHIGHCKAIRFNFKLAQDSGGYTNLRYDDTNPEKETQEFIDQIQENVRWLGYEPKNIYFASDYSDKFYEYALTLIKNKKAFVCFLSQQQSKELRESLKPSPYRETSVEENLKHFKLMKSGYYDEGQAVLRAKIDYKNQNPVMRDPPIYRIKFSTHPHQGDKWCIYPLYDFVHCISDSIEDITHSCCTLEFEVRRDLYYWFLNELDLYKPHVWEYSRLNLSYNVLSKRKVTELVEKKQVDGWDDPRLLTIAGIQRRGYPPEALHYFCDLISVSRRGNDTQLDFSLFEFCMRNHLKKVCPHAFGVIEPVPLTLTNLDENKILSKDFHNFIYDFSLTKVVYVERADVRKTDDSGFFGCAPGKIVRLRYGPFVKINEVGDHQLKGEIIPDDKIDNYKKIKGILHWVGKDDSVEIEVRVYDRLFTTPFPGKERSLIDDVDKNSKKVYKNSRIPKGCVNLLKDKQRWQFERKGFYFVDKDTDLSKGKIVMNQTIGMKQSKLKTY